MVRATTTSQLPRTDGPKGRGSRGRPHVHLDGQERGHGAHSCPGSCWHLRKLDIARGTEKDPLGVHTGMHERFAHGSTSFYRISELKKKKEAGRCFKECIICSVFTKPLLVP